MQDVCDASCGLSINHSLISQLSQICDSAAVVRVNRYAITSIVFDYLPQCHDQTESPAHFTYQYIYTHLPYFPFHRHISTIQQTLSSLKELTDQRLHCSFSAQYWPSSVYPPTATLWVDGAASPPMYVALQHPILSFIHINLSTNLLLPSRASKVPSPI